MFVAHDNGVAQFYDASEHVSGNIGTAGVIAEVFGEQFVLPVWSRKSRFNRDLRNGEDPKVNDYYYLTRRAAFGK